MMRLSSVRIFTQVVEAGSFSAAGRGLGLAPSSVSRQIADLEDELGARLFHRTTRRLSLTEAGQVFYARAGKILVDLEEAKLAGAQPGGAPSGVLRLTVPGSLGRLHLVPAIADFQQGHPAVKVGLVVTDRLVDLVEEGFDLAIRVGRQRDSSLVARRIGTSRRLVSAAVAGLGLVLVPEWLVGPDLRAGRLQEVLTDYRASPDATPLYALYPHRRHLPAKVRAFVDFLAARFAPTYDWGGGPA